MNDDVDHLASPLAGIPDDADQSFVVGRRLLQEQLVVAVSDEADVQVVGIITTANEKAQDRARPE